MQYNDKKVKHKVYDYQLYLMRANAIISSKF